MKIVVDENIPYGAEAFGTLGEAIVLPASGFTPETVRDADALAIRSVTKITPALLEGSSVKYVGTATIGVDHVDQAYLKEKGIAFASAPGCNAMSVAEYVTAAILHICAFHDHHIKGMTLGVVGVGNVGSKVVEKGKALGLRVLQNDPPRARAEGDDGFTDLETLLRESDIVTTHVPLTKDGPDATAGLAGEDFFRAIKNRAIYLNTSRGPVVDEVALQGALRRGQVAHAVLDVWQNEPAINLNLLPMIHIASPHIAGYSFDGKVTGTQMIYDACCEALGLDSTWTPTLPEADVPVIEMDGSSGCTCEVLDACIRQVYDILADDTNLRKALALPSEEAGPWFTRLRKEYPRRREFRYTTLKLKNAPSRLLEVAENLGFMVE